MWILMLNDMRSGKFEQLSPVVKADTQEKLKAFVESQKVSHYKTPAQRFADGPKGIGSEIVNYEYHKGFVQGGPLEWYNQPSGFNEDNHFVDLSSYDDETKLKLEEMYKFVPVI